MPVLHRLLQVVAFFIVSALSAAIVFFVGSGFTLLVTMQLDSDSIRPTKAVQVDQSNLRAIGQTTLIYAQDHNENLPRADTIWGYAALLSERGGLTESDFWVTRTLHPKHQPVLLPGPRGERPINPVFPSQTPTVAVPNGMLTLAMPSTMPIAWTAGLSPDGTWSAESAYGGKEGLICFLGGNVRQFKNLHEDGGALVHYQTGRKTSNILEALPPGTTILEAPQGPLNEAFERKRIIESLRGAIQIGWFVWLILVFAPVNFLLLRAFGLHARRVPKWLLLLPAGWALGLILAMVIMRQF